MMKNLARGGGVDNYSFGDSIGAKVSFFLPGHFCMMYQDSFHLIVFLLIL
jgi:hypothetical protein